MRESRDFAEVDAGVRRLRMAAWHRCTSHDIDDDEDPWIAFDDMSIKTEIEVIHDAIEHADCRTAARYIASLNREVCKQKEMREDVEKYLLECTLIIDMTRFLEIDTDIEIVELIISLCTSLALLSYPFTKAMFERGLAQATAKVYAETQLTCGYVIFITSVLHNHRDAKRSVYRMNFLGALERQMSYEDDPEFVCLGNSCFGAFFTGLELDFDVNVELNYARVVLGASTKGFSNDSVRRSAIRCFTALARDALRTRTLMRIGVFETALDWLGSFHDVMVYETLQLLRMFVESVMPDLVQTTVAVFEPAFIARYLNEENSKSLECVIRMMIKLIELDQGKADEFITTGAVAKILSNMRESSFNETKAAIELLCLVSSQSSRSVDRKVLLNVFFVEKMIELCEIEIDDLMRNMIRETLVSLYELEEGSEVRSVIASLFVDGMLADSDYIPLSALAGM